MPKKVTIIKLPAGSPAPPGFTQGRTTRRGATFFKVENTAAAVPASSFNMSGLADALDEIMAPVAVDVPDDQVDALMAQLGAMGFGGRKRKTRGAKKGGRKTRRRA